MSRRPKMVRTSTGLSYPEGTFPPSSTPEGEWFDPRSNNQPIGGHYNPERSFPPQLACLYLKERGAQIFSRWQVAATNPETPTFKEMLFLETPDFDRPVRLTLSVWSYSVMRQGGPFTALSATSIIGRANVQQPFGHHSRLKAKLGWGGASGGSTRIFDIGSGVQFAVTAKKATLSILYPTNGFINPRRTGVGALPTLGGTVLDDFVGAMFAETFNSPATTRVPNTEIVQIAQGATDREIIRPAGADMISVVQTSTGTVLVPDFRPNSPGLAAPVQPSLGQLTLGTNRRAEDIRVPGPTGLILTGAADPDNVRVASFTWSMPVG